MVDSVLFASQFPPENLWLILAAYLGGCVVVIGLSFWAAARFWGSGTLVFAGMFLGGMLATKWAFGLMPAGAAAGALLGAVLGVTIVRKWWQ